MKHIFKFTTELGKNLLLYSQAVQKQMYQELEELLPVSFSKNKSHFELFQANIYICTFGAFSYPTSLDLERNGNGILVKSKTFITLRQWLLKRLNNSGVKENFLLHTL